MEKLRDAYSRETDPAKSKALALAVQNRAIDQAQYAWLGMWYGPGASRTSVVGWLKAPVVVHWTIEKK
jgi:peptide/nickel transport system substrate-binding protein